MNTVRDNLMYCDLVSRNGIIHKVGVDGNCFRIVDAEGIPITPEILEKNGFVFDCDFWTIANPRYNNVRMVRYCSIDEDATDAFLGHWAFDENYAIDFVHELQHALRLCGLNEIADNFKVQHYETETLHEK